MKRFVSALWPKSRKKRVSVVVFVVALVAVSTAFAAWLITSNVASPRGKAGTAATLVIATPASGSVVSDPACVPGGYCDVQVTATGAQGYSATQAQLTFGGAGNTLTVAETPATCPAGSFITNTTLYPAESFVNLPAPILMTAGTTVITIPDAVQMSPTAPIACAGQQFTVGGAGGGFAIKASVGS